MSFTSSRHNKPITIAILLHEGMTASDAVGPYEALRSIPGATVKFVAETPGPKRMDSGFLSLVADYALEDVPHPDVLVVCPGNPAAVPSERVLSWIRTAHETSRWTTSVCGGSVLLGAAGLLRGVQATTHWLAMDQLAQFGAIARPDQHYVRDGKIVTAAGNSAGIDMALYLVEQIAGREIAEATQLLMQYDPQPPFHAGSPAQASPRVIGLAQEFMQNWIASTPTPDGQMS
jgi:transcriptional regulator GlxA family with amidase domain